ncbi:MAG: hypothetical protein H6R25_2107 [Proteobacteria bacterium]|nr:hypothetical protein [Pseudomonadota bacterium]
MSLLLYGIVAEDTQPTSEPDGTPHVGEEPLRLVKTATLAALVKSCGTEASGAPTAVLDFGQQIMHVHQRATIIPIRYGCVLKDDAAVTRHLLNHEAHYRAQLVELANCDEMGIRLSLAPVENNAVVMSKTSGLDYLRSRKLAYAVPEHAERQAALLNNALMGLYRRHCAAISMFNGQRTYLLSYLVPRIALPEFLDTLKTMANNMTDIGFVSGPWPPYNFTS